MENDNIFVSIASYRDSQCYDTVFSLFKNAKNPMNIFVGICEQNDENEINENCFYNKDIDFFETFKNNVRKITLSYKEAKGPTYARYLCSTLWRNEKYFFQIDSHSKFVKDWDIKCITMINRLKNVSQKPVLSHYPLELSEYDTYDEQNKHLLPRICQAFFNERNMISFNGSELIDTKDEFYLTNFTAGGMLFCESYFLNELPFDPQLPYLFVGEEILHSARFYTHGWDIYTPTENIVFHSYTRADKPKIWTDNPYYSDLDAFEKVKIYLELDGNDISKIKNDEVKESISKYGLGNKRSLNDFYNHCGIDHKNKIITKNFCGKDIYVHNQKNNTNFGWVLFFSTCLILIIVFAINFFKR